MGDQVKRNQDNLVTVNQLAARWQIEPRQARVIIRRHLDVLQPTKPGRAWLMAWENILKYEQQQRVKR